MRSRSAMWLACLVLGACSGGGDGGGDEAPPAQTTGAISILNSSSQALSSVFVDPSDATVYSDRRNDAPIAPGETFTVAGLAPGSWTWLVRTESEVGFIAGSESDLVEAGETSHFVVLDSDFHGRLEVTNGADVEITEIHLGLDGSWEARNWLETPLAAGATFLLPLHVYPGPRDVRCDYADREPFTGSYEIQSLTLTRVTCL